MTNGVTNGTTGSTTSGTTGGTTGGTTSGTARHRRAGPAMLVLPLSATLTLTACGGGDGGTEPLGQGAITVGALDAGTSAAPAPDPDPGPTSPDASTDSTTAGTTDGSTEGTTEGTSTTDGAGATPGTEDAGAEAVGLPPRPAVDACVTVPVPPDGVYTVYDAGTAVVTVTGAALGLGHVQAADGWTVRVDEQGTDEVEVDFRRGGEVLDLEVEVDDGRVEARICSDDD